MLASQDEKSSRPQRSIRPGPFDPQVAVPKTLAEIECGFISLARLLLIEIHFTSFRGQFMAYVRPASIVVLGSSLSSENTVSSPIMD
jgi:hypothetical protein